MKKRETVSLRFSTSINLELLSNFPDEMKRSESELAFEEFFKKTNINPELDAVAVTENRDSNDGLGEIRSPRRGDNDSCFFGEIDFHFYRNRELVDVIANWGEVLAGGNVWSENLTPKQSCISATIDSQSSIVK